MLSVLVISSFVYFAFISLKELKGLYEEYLAENYVNNEREHSLQHISIILFGFICAVAMMLICEGLDKIPLFLYFIYGSIWIVPHLARERAEKEF